MTCYCLTVSQYVFGLGTMMSVCVCLYVCVGLGQHLLQHLCSLLIAIVRHLESVLVRINYISLLSVVAALPFVHCRLMMHLLYRCLRFRPCD